MPIICDALTPHVRAIPCSASVRCAVRETVHQNRIFNDKTGLAPRSVISLHLPQALAQATANAVMFSTRRTVAAGVRMWAVAAVPISTGPTVTPPLVVVFSTL